MSQIKSIKYSTLFFLWALITGCAEGRIEVLGKNNEVLGECSAKFYWHPYGAQHSVNYMLYICAKEHIASGKKVSDQSILDKDYTLPVNPEGLSWNKINASAYFKEGFLTEEKYGYILAAIEYEYIVTTRVAKERLKSNKIDRSTYEKIVKNARIAFHGN